MAEWSRIVNTTISEYIRPAEENILRSRKVLALFKSKGRISMGHSGDKMDWKVKYKRAPMQGYADSDTLTFSRRDRWKTAELDWRGYAATDAMTKKERLMNKSTEAIVKIYSEVASNLLDDIEDQFGDEIFVDGNASGNSKRIHGLESMFGVSGPSPAGYVGLPSDTYAGLSTTLGAYGGSWSTDGGGNVEWPTGQGDAHYDFWSPLVVDYTDTAWTATTKTWPNTCREAMRYGILKGKRNKSRKGMLDIVLLNDEMYRQFCDALEDHERIVVQKGPKGGLYDLGFIDAFVYEGAEISFDHSIPATVGYGFATAHMELCSLQDQLFVPEGPDFDIASQSWRFSIDFFGNMRCNPRYATKWDNVS